MSPLLRNTVSLFLVLVVAILLRDSVQMLFVGASRPESGKPCEGVPLEVDYPFHGGMNPPHACKPQCDDDVQRYILYSNGMATQCQLLPGCLDWGEDQGVTCETWEK